ncbi:MAG TPA: hypothetical protein VJ909_01535, partial [Prolixibacteraceae bacterium]|nr:hypothetical protein [Prolixibacteraceae bacterium]
PSSIDGFDEYIETSHPVNVKKLVEAYGVNYYFSDGLENIDRQFDDFVHSEKASVFEVKTPKSVNPEVFKSYIDAIKQK